MNASSQSFPGNPPDGEITAELPVLDVAAYEARHGQDTLATTDTWSTPTLNSALLPQTTNLAPETHDTTQAMTLASKLEAELRSLAHNLSELETRLAAKGERLTIIERELADSRAAGQGFAERAAALSEELNSTRAELAAASAQIEGLTHSVSERDAALHAANVRETDLTQQLHSRETELHSNAELHATKLASLTAGYESNTASLISGYEASTASLVANHESATASLIAHHEANTASLVASHESTNSGLIAAHESAIGAARQQIARLQVQTASQLETLQSLEGRRGIFDSILRAMDLQILGRDEEKAKLNSDLARNTTHEQELTAALDAQGQRVTQLEAELASLNSRLVTRTEESETKDRGMEQLQRTVEGLRGESTAWGTRVTELESQLTAGNQIHAEALRAAATAHTDMHAANSQLTQQKSNLEAELQTLRLQSQEHVTAVQQVAAEHAVRLSQIEEQNAKITALAAQVANQSQTILADSDKLRTLQEQMEVAENDQKVSEDAINRLEADLRARNMRVEELTRINTKMQNDIAEARVWLDERDSLMKRLETEAAHSSTLVDAIQRSVRSMAPGTTGPHEVVRESAGTRLLVRSSKDGREVVHVLGRKTTVGRTPDNDLQIDATFISRHHAVLLFTNQQTVVEDLNSTNGVYVNGKRTTRETLNDGDLVMIGKARFRFAIRPSIPRSNPEPVAQA